MAKISELKNEKIIENILKYEKIIAGLYKERALRLKKDPSLKTVLLTPEEQRDIQEIEKNKEADNKGDSSDIFQLSFDDNEIASMQEKAAITKGGSVTEQNMQITQVLKLTPEQLKEFNTKKKSKE